MLAYKHNYNRKVYWVLFLLSFTMICFEILSTRISSVIFVSNYAFIILSTAILGLGLGGVFAYYKILTTDLTKIIKTISLFIAFTGLALCLFIINIVILKITNPFIYFFLLILPFLSSGISYSLIFRLFASKSFKLYTADLTGAALGSGLSLILFYFFNAVNGIIFLALVLFLSALILSDSLGKSAVRHIYLLLFPGLILLAIFGHKDILGKIPIGYFPEKDFFHVYPNLKPTDCQITDSKWSLYGRTDLVTYKHQNVVKQIFIDGAAGSPMYRFDGDLQNPNNLLQNLLIRSSTTIPFLLQNDYAKKNLLVIGPGGGKEVLTGLITGFRWITGVEVNPDIIDVVKEQQDFNGGIYTKFPKVQILAKEGRHYIKKVEDKFDMIVLALPSTEQVQNIDYLSTSENYLLTVEALQDYLQKLTPEGSLVFTVHNQWELVRLIITSVYAFEKLGVNNQEVLDHFIILSKDYTPTIIIKKSPYTPDQITKIKDFLREMPSDIPQITYFPFDWTNISNTIENKLLKALRDNQISLQQYIDQDLFDISPVYDDKPYFYKVNRGIQKEYLLFFFSVIFLGILLLIFPLARIRQSIAIHNKKIVSFSLIVFSCLGIGFMLLEVTLFQKLILYLGSPTISLAVLLSSLLIGMGTGSFFGEKLFSGSIQKRLTITTIAIILFGAFSFVFYPWLLNKLLIHGQLLRSTVCYILLLPVGFLLGVPFPTTIKLLKDNELEKFIPWMYGINGIMSVLGSVMAVIISMLYGFTIAFYTGLGFYLIIFLINQFYYIKKILRRGYYEKVSN